LNEAVRCDKQIRGVNKHHSDKDHTVKVFTRLMLRGNVRAAVRWLSERGRVRLLNSRSGTLSLGCIE
jgi:hypothetical protein